MVQRIVIFGVRLNTLSQKLIRFHRLAEQAIREVFEREYYGLAGIQLPEVDFIPPGEKGYITGQYSITIGENWRIHLNFGKLPKNGSDFTEEVKALARHEIEHFKTCPFDVITHFRLVHRILRTIRMIDLGMDGPTAPEDAKRIANEFADVVVDTVNFKRLPAETVSSEIDWIKKSGEGVFSASPRSSRLMFLLKEVIWNENLDLNEKDESLLSEVRELAAIMSEAGIENKNLFFKKAEAYTVVFLKMYKLDIEDSKYPNITGADTAPSKRDYDDGDNIIFENPERTKNATIVIAQETTLQEFLEILQSVDIQQLENEENESTWYEAQNIDEIPLEYQLSNKSSEDIMYPDNWKIGDPIEELDLLLSLQTMPKLIPGVSTKKWSTQPKSIGGDQKSDADLLLVIDSSGSMGSKRQSGSSMQEAILASFGFIKYFERKKSQIAAINFSTNSRVVSWTRDYNLVKESLLHVWGKGTNFPIIELNDVVKKKQERIVLVIITDGDISNREDANNLFEDLLLLRNKVFLFLMGSQTGTDKYKRIEGSGGVVEQVSSATEIRNFVFSNLNEI